MQGLFLSGCQKTPQKSPSAEPMAAKALKPMGSATSNVELGKKLEELNKTLKETGANRQFKLAEFYFNERRFIESAKLLSLVLDEKPHYPTARNLLARCFYFLGNPDRTLQELEYILINQQSDVNEFFDALYLIGAAVLESNMAAEKPLKKAIASWESYLRMAGDSPYKAEVKSGLNQLKSRLKHLHVHTSKELS